ncbi:unnamed protein product [Linum tenue]|uniref:Non-haem dioxygenase N-terminal domain-containing protein n=1 Tax=Linum tenue TaxID=586396 RepID=A0AAV0KS95_9ROSI|nr:unnamed protein product [Linum tenue]
MIRSDSDKNLQAPPPSPIPTAKGCRSAANSIFTNYLHHSLQVPDLSEVPDSMTTSSVAMTPELSPKPYPYEPQEISLPSIESRDDDAVNRLLQAAREFGTFTITDHGISAEELRSLIQNAERVFQVLEDTDMGHPPRNFAKFREYKEQIEWVRSGEERMEWARGWVSRDGSRHFGEVMEKIATKLDAMAKLICEVFSENWTKRQFGRRFEEKDSVVRLYRYNNRSNESHAELANQQQQHTDDSVGHALCLHLPVSISHFLLQSSQGLLSFDAGPRSLIVSVGRRLQEWSLGDFKCISEEVVCSPQQEGGKPSYSVELKCLSLNFDVSRSKKKRLATISVRNQIMIGLALALLYKLVVYVCSTWEAYKLHHL